MEHKLTDEIHICREILEVCNRLHQKNMLAACDGNVSFRLKDECIYVTPAGKAKAFMDPDDIAVLSLQGDVITGHPSSETEMHLKIYQQCPNAKAVIHAHPPTATAWTVAHPDLTELPNDCISEMILACGGIPVVPYARPGSVEMGENLVPYLPAHRVMILARHGAISWGETLNEAYFGMERLEHSAQVLQIAHSLGGLTSLPEEEVKILETMRKDIGERTF